MITALLIVLAALLTFGSGYIVLRILGQNEQLKQDLLQRDRDIIALRNENDGLTHKIDEAEVRDLNLRRRIGKLMRHSHQLADERDLAQQMLDMVLDFDLENNQAFGSVSCEIGVNGVHYQFYEKASEVPV